MNNLYERITAQIISNLQSAESWQKLWDVPQPVSLNGHNYTGINYLLLGCAGYSSPVWGTFNQVRQNGGMVNRGESSRPVVFWKRKVEQKPDPVNGKLKDVVSFLLRYYNVFNTDQCSFDEMGKQKIVGLTGTSLSANNQRFTPADEIIALMPDAPQIKHGSDDIPCYVPSLDEIRIPRLEYFHCSEAYYATMYHEMVHATGHKKRLNRFESDQFSNRETYSKEELVAELGSAFLSTIAGIDHNMVNTQAYIKSWLQVLSDNPSWITWAASRAQKACEFIMPSLIHQQEVETAEQLA